MKSKLPHALAGLALALVLALVGDSSGAGNDDTDGAGKVVAAANTARGVPVAHFESGELDEKLLIQTTTTTSTSTTTTTAAPAPEPEPAPEPAPEPEPVAAPAGSVEEIINRYFGASASKAMAVARCESGLNPSAMSPGGGNHGLFQINNVHSPRFESVTGVPWSGRYDAEANTRFAKWLFDQSGWGPWACA